MSDLGICTSSKIELPPKSMIREDIITQTSSTQTNDYASEEVSDVEHEDSSQEIPLCDSSPLNATHSKNIWPILKNCDFYLEWKKEMENIIIELGPEIVISELKKNPKYTLPEEARLILDDCNTLD